MPFPTTPILDDFNRANESPIAAPWAHSAYWWPNALDLVSQAVGNSDPACCSGSYWTTTPFGPSFEVYVTVSTLATFDADSFGIDLFTTVPTSGPLDNFTMSFEREVGGATYLTKLVRYDNDVPTLVYSGSWALSAGDQVGLRRYGTTFYLFRNGEILAVASDGNYVVPMYAGLYVFDAARQTVRLDDFGGGTIVGPGENGGWTRRATGTVATGTTSLTITKPSGTLDNDIMLMSLSHKGAGFATVPAGWTLIERDISGAIRGEMYWKRAASEGANYSVTGLADTACGNIVSYIGGLLSGDVVADSAVSVNASGVETCPSVTTALPNQLVFPMIAISANNAVSFTPPLTAGALTYTEVSDGGTTNGTDCRVANAHTLPPAAGATGAVNLSFTNAESVAITVALIAEPSPGPGDTAYRFYSTLCPTNIRVNGTVPGDWNTTARILNGGGWGTDALTVMQPNKANGGTQTTNLHNNNNQGDWDALLAQWTTPPLAAQTIDGTFDLCFMMNITWNTPSTITNDSHAVWKIHVAIMVGQTAVVRHVLLDNYVDATEFQRGSATGVWQSLTAPQALTPGDAEEGDTIIVAMGYRLLSSPTPPPIYPSEPFNNDANYSILIVRGFGTTASLAGVGLPDAPPGNSSLTTFSPWFEFSGGLTLSSTVISPNANDECADAVVAPTVPYRSPTVDTSGGLLAYHPAWYTFVAPRSGVMFASQLGSTYGCRFNVYTDGCGTLTPVTIVPANSTVSRQRGIEVCRFTVVGGTQYWVVAHSQSHTSNQSRFYGGLFQITLFYQETAEVDDLYLPCLQTVAWRRYPDGEIYPVNVAYTEDLVPTAIAIDYTQRPMDDLGGGVNTSVRLLVAAHHFNLVEIFDIDDFHEVDFISAEENIDDVNLNKHPSQMHITPEGEMALAYFGNGYLFILGFGADHPAFYNAVSDELRFVIPQTVDATAGDNQPSFPVAAVDYSVDQDGMASAFISRLGNTLYYIPSSWYVPFGSGQTIKRWDLVLNSALPDFATLPVSPDPFMPGMRGHEVLPDGTVLATNATYAVWLNQAGQVVQTYVPSRPMFGRSLTDIRATADGLRVWVVDEDTAALFLFDLITGVEIATYDTWQTVSSLVQMAIYQPDGVVIGCPGTRGDPVTDGLPYTPVENEPCEGTGERGDPPIGA